MTTEEIYEAVRNLNPDQATTFSYVLEGMFMRENPFWDGPYMLIPFFADMETVERSLDVALKRDRE